MVTGAGSGIGKAISLALAEEGCHLCILGRNEEKLRDLMAEISSMGVPITLATFDLSQKDEIETFVNKFRQETGKLDILINCGADYEMGRLCESEAEIYERLFDTNVKGQMLLSTKLLPCFPAGSGQIVCINSSSGVNVNSQAGIFSASKHAFRVLTDTLRAEVNEKGIRVLSVYPGRTNTPLIEKIFEQEDRAYEPEKLLQPEDVATTTIHCLKLPFTAEVTDIHIRPFIKSY